MKLKEQLSVPATLKVDNEIINVPVEKLKFWENNPRKNDTAVPKLAELIKVRGQVTPIVAWRKTGVVYKGNTTLKALKYLGMKTARVLYADFPSETAAIAYGISDNKSSEWSEWDMDILSSFLKKEEISSIPTGFNFNEISLFSVTGTVDLGNPLDNLLKIKSMFGGTASNILNYALCKDGKLIITNLDNIFSISVNTKLTGAVNLKVLAGTRSIADSIVDVDVNSFPSIPIVTSSNNENKKIFKDVGTIEKCISIRKYLESLHYINALNGKLFATDGNILRFKTIKEGITFSIDRISAQIIDYMYEWITDVYIGKEWLKFIGDGFTLFCKNFITAETIKQLIPIVNSDFIGKKLLVVNNDIYSMINTLIPFFGETSKLYIYPDKIGYTDGIDGAISYYIKGKTGLNSGVMLFDYTYIVDTITEKTTVAFTDKYVRFETDGISTVIMRMKLIDKILPKFRELKINKSINFPIFNESIQFTSELNGGTLKGTIKGAIREACISFVNKNFNKVVIL